MSFNQDSESFRVTKEIILAHVSHSQVRSESLPDLIREVHKAVLDIRSSGASTQAMIAPAPAPAPTPAAPAAESVPSRAAPAAAPAPAPAPPPAPVSAAPSFPQVERPSVPEPQMSLTVQVEDQPTAKAPEGEAASKERTADMAEQSGPTKQQSGPTKQKPAVPIEESVQPDYIVCLEDGKKFKMMKRYLRATYGMTPEEYRAKWGLPDDYPMVAPAYRAEKSAYAKLVGLGTEKLGKRRKKAAA